MGVETKASMPNLGNAPVWSLMVQAYHRKKSVCTTLAFLYPL
jgi:hypothetical protein